MREPALPERGFLTETWDEDWFQEMSRDQRYLFVYLSTNNHCNQAGVYHITLATIAFESKIPVEELPDLLHSLSPKAEWYPGENYIWVKNFIKKQAKSPKFLVAAAKALKNIRNNGLVKEVIEYNLREYRISIPYEHNTDTVSIQPDTVAAPSASDTGTDTVSDTEERGDVKGGEESEGELINALPGLKGWRVDEDDVDWLRDFRSEFPDFDFRELKACAAYYSGRAPPKHKGIWKNRFRNWMIKKREFEKEKSGEQAKGQRVKGSRPAADFRGRKW